MADCQCRLFGQKERAKKNKKTKKPNCSNREHRWDFGQNSSGFQLLSNLDLPVSPASCPAYSLTPPSVRTLQLQGPSSVPQTHPVLSSRRPFILLLLLECASFHSVFGYHLPFCSGLNLDAISSERLSIDLPQSKSAPLPSAAICSTFVAVFTSIVPVSHQRERAP